MIHEYEINGLKVRTGDLICTVDGDANSILGWIWWLIGRIIPGKVDHIAVYLGPEGRCVEAGAKGKVITWQVRGRWDPYDMVDERGPLVDTFYGVAYPLAGRGLGAEEENGIRQRVAEYCLEQVRLEKPYNFNFFNPSTEKAFYCSQLAYRAYLREGIDLNSDQGVPEIPGTERIVFPQEIWDGCIHEKA